MRLNTPTTSDGWRRNQNWDLVRRSGETLQSIYWRRGFYRWEILDRGESSIEGSVRGFRSELEAIRSLEAYLDR